MKSKDYPYQFVGRKFNRLTVISVAEKKVRSDGRNYNMVECRCDCGTQKTFNLSEVISNHSRSCGCYRRDRTKEALRKHGKSNDSIYKVWAGAKRRCTNENDSGYKNYGGRGITMCAEWIDNSSAFMQWALSNGYRQGLDIDRIDNNGDYSPENCRFVSRTENMRNNRRNRIIEYNGLSLPVSEMCERLNLKYSVVNKRLWRGWDVIKSIETPPNSRWLNHIPKSVKQIPDPGEQIKLTL